MSAQSGRADVQRVMEEPISFKAFLALDVGWGGFECVAAFGLPIPHGDDCEYVTAMIYFRDWGRNFSSDLVMLFVFFTL